MKTIYEKVKINLSKNEQSSKVDSVKKELSKFESINLSFKTSGRLTKLLDSIGKRDSIYFRHQYFTNKDKTEKVFMFVSYKPRGLLFVKAKVNHDKKLLEMTEYGFHKFEYNKDNKRKQSIQDMKKGFKKYAEEFINDQKDYQPIPDDITTMKDFVIELSRKYKEGSTSDPVKTLSSAARRMVNKTPGMKFLLSIGMRFDYDDKDLTTLHEYNRAITFHEDGSVTYNNSPDPSLKTFEKSKKYNSLRDLLKANVNTFEFKYNVEAINKYLDIKVPKKGMYDIEEVNSWSSEEYDAYKLENKPDVFKDLLSVNGKPVDDALHELAKLAVSKNIISLGKDEEPSDWYHSYYSNFYYMKDYVGVMYLNGKTSKIKDVYLLVNLKSKEIIKSGPKFIDHNGFDESNSKYFR